MVGRCSPSWVEVGGKQSGLRPTLTMGITASAGKSPWAPAGTGNSQHWLLFLPENPQGRLVYQPSFRHQGPLTGKLGDKQVPPRDGLPMAGGHHLDNFSSFKLKNWSQVTSGLKWHLILSNVWSKVLVSKLI